MEKSFKNINVSCSSRGIPRVIQGSKGEITVEKVLESWNDTGCWWEGENEKIFYRLYCRGGGILEIFCDLASGNWYIYRVYD